MKNTWIIGAVLFASIAANIAFLSLSIGRYYPMRPVAQPRPIEMIMRRIDSLPEEKREWASEILERSRLKLLADIRDLRDSEVKLYAAMIGDKYDRTDLENQMADIRGKSSYVQAQAQIIMLDIADKLTPEERKEFLRRKPKPHPDLQPVASTDSTRK